MTPEIEIITAPQMLEPHVDLNKAYELLFQMSEKDKTDIKVIMSLMKNLQLKNSTGIAVVSDVSASAIVVEFLGYLGYRKIQVITPPYSDGPITLVDW